MTQRKGEKKARGPHHPRRRERACKMPGLNGRPAGNIETMQRSRQPADPVTNAASFLCCPSPSPSPGRGGGGGDGWLSRRPALIGSIVATDQPPMLCDGHKRCLCATSLHLSHLPLPVSNMARLSGRQQLLRDGAPRLCLGSSVCGFCFGPWPDPLRRSSLTPSLPREQETETHQDMVEGWCHKSHHSRAG